MAKGLPKRSEDFSAWYNELVGRADLAEHSGVKGCMVVKPYGYAIWENMKAVLDQKFKETGHQNAYFPMFIPKSFIEKEAEHVEGFSPELATVTHAGGKELEEPLIVRPTSETIINHMFSKWISSHRDLPMLINQWSNVVRWEMRTRLFLRTSEFLWQEGHTAHATEDEAREESLKMLDIYEEFARDIAAVSVVKGTKSEMEKFAGATTTYSIEAMMNDLKALQAGTSHELGQNFSKAFDIKFSDENNKLQHPFQTSWGVSTRLVGMIIMAHGDDKGLKLPPELAPHQVVIVPIIPNEDERSRVLNAVNKLIESLDNVRVFIDDRPEVSPGFKFNEWEQKGVPIRIEVGPKDIDNGSVLIYRRDDESKNQYPFEGIDSVVDKTLNDIQKNLLITSENTVKSNTYHVDSYDELIETLNDKKGFVSCFWDENKEDEIKVKEKTSATLRCYPINNKEIEKSVNSKDNDGNFAIFSKAY